ncbi:MAG TPA: NAD(P)-binding domain-containing protein, partial [Thermoleophilia bacterium]|nr:NAD(P)-binding domain-containing protein [Thermoleophilia bacterium]
MDIGIIGLGKMGANMARRLVAGGHRVVVANRSPEPVAQLATEGAVPARDLAELVGLLSPPRAAWIMVPAGDPTEKMVLDLADLLTEGDVIVDGGNSNYKDSMRRAATMAERGLGFVDAGTSGGIWGRTEGYSLMVGGTEESVALVRPALESLAPAADLGWGHVGPAGAGHFVKMVHNGI